MAGLQEQVRWENEIYRIEENDPVHGGENGITNKPIKQLANRTKYLKEEVDRRYTAQDASTTGKGIVQLDSSTISNAENKAATPKAVKTVKELTDGKVAKSGDTMTGILEIDKGDSYVRGKVGRTNKWYVGKGSSSSDDITLWSDAYNSGVTLKSDRTEVTKPLYIDRHKVFYEGDYPEASDTRFGLVMLSHKTDGTDRTKAASEYALGEVRRLANQANVAIDGIALTWANVQQKPTTLSGFGITDAVSTNKVSNSVSSTSQTNVGSSLAVKTAYDNAESRVSKRGDTMTGLLTLNVTTDQIIKGAKNGQDIFYIGTPTNSQNLTFYHHIYGTQFTMGRRGIYSNKDILVNDNLVYHAGNLPRANLAQAGIARLSSSTTSSDENQAATPKAVKIAYDKGVEAKQTADNALQTANGKQSPATTLGGYGITDAVSIRNVSNAVNSTSQANVASSQAVKTAYDKGVEANNNAQGRVSKSGDTMRGKLIIEGLNHGGHSDAGVVLCNLGSGKGTAVHFDGCFHSNKTNKGGMHIVDGGGGSALIEFFVTPDGNDNQDRRHKAFLIDKNGALWAKQYGWLHDYFMRREDFVRSWYPNHYAGAEVYKIRHLGLMITVMNTSFGNRELILPESHDGHAIVLATDRGAGRIPVHSNQFLGGNRIRIGGRDDTHCSVLVIGMKSF